MMNDKDFFGQFANIKPYDYRRAVTDDIRNGLNDICPNDISDSYQGILSGSCMIPCETA